MSNHKETAVSHTAPHEGLTGFYIIDPVHSTIGFSVRRAMIINVSGKFTAFEGLLKIDGPHPARSEAYLSIQTGSVDTGFRERDAHVTGPDFLDSATFPLMSFRSTRIVDAGDERFRLAGYLRIKDVELPIHINLEFGGASRDVSGQRCVGFEGAATLQRSDWGLGGSAALATGGVLNSDKVKLLLDISAVRLDQAEAA